MPPVILVTGANRGIGFCIAQASDAVRKLKALAIQGTFEPMSLDVTSDQSMHGLIALIKERHGKLDVLINNAGIAAVPSSDLSDYSQAFNSVLDTNVTSVGLLTSLLTPLLRQSESAKVINISSGRASVERLTSGDLPPTVSVPYSVSKVALNIMTLEMAKTESNITFYLANPGHCSTAFNGYKGKKDPLLGAEVAANLAFGDYKSGFWHNDEGSMQMMPW
ncbi:NAD(P)-binding protein [Aureobasidium namibiae CBS 147.97]|uniref:NAD(P)-binding protein n=1 Tax=Aureobasidium namibiae CBS 147.97 TaxID=1043004 RepID=A0A074X8B4_9PEZI|nr:NAD(P)-binding protein [Aureobasidium namibiae CBS 147.97]KEQ78277.1 NAD(P)-binding protein [Aureobasidium namibiae CBS 147.97]